MTNPTGMLADTVSCTSSRWPRPRCLALLLPLRGLWRPGWPGLVSLLGFRSQAQRSGAGWADLMPSRPRRR